MSVVETVGAVLAVVPVFGWTSAPPISARSRHRPSPRTPGQERQATPNHRWQTARTVDTSHTPRAVHEAAAEKNRRHAELQDDRRRVEAYGAEHLDVFAGVTSVLAGETSRLVAGFTRDLDSHSARLRELVSHADRLDVIEVPASQPQLEQVRSAIFEELGFGPDKPLRRLSGPGGGAFRVHVDLAAYAEEGARRLVERYGDAVEVRVGVLGYPVDLGEGRPAPLASQEPPLDDTVDIHGVRPLVVRSGYELDSELLITNHGPSSLVIENWGKEIGRVLDPATGEVVGGFSGGHPAPLVRFTASPGESVTVPLIVGTASYRRSLGYAVPPGEWAVEVVLDLGTNRRRRAPLLPLHVTP